MNPVEMDYVLETSLQQTALVKILAILWTQDDVKNLLSEFNYHKHAEFQSLRWKKIESLVVEKVAQLPLPKKMKEKISCFITPVGFQIKQWKYYLYNDCRLSLALPNEFCWTSQGTIDKKKTAEVMIKNQSIDIATRYSLACIHCLEDDIPKLWEKIPKSCRTSFYSTADHCVSSLVEFWTYCIMKNKHKMNRMIQEEVGYRMSPYVYAFQVAVNSGFRVAAEYFLEKLTAGEACLVSTAMDIAYDSFLPDDYYAEIFCFILSYLDEKDQKTVLGSNPSQILISLLDYPFHHFFMGTANLMWNILDKNDYVYVLDGIVYQIQSGYKDFDYQKLLAEFWQKIPVVHKRHVLSQDMFYSTVRDLFDIRDEDIIRLIFQDATPEEKKRLFYHDDAQGICKNLLNGDDPQSLLKYFIRECLPSKDEVIGFKEHLENGQIGEFQFKLLLVLDEVIGEFKKRKHEENDSTKAKKV